MKTQRSKKKTVKGKQRRVIARGETIVYTEPGYEMEIRMQKDSMANYGWTKIWIYTIPTKPVLLIKSKKK